MAALMAVVPCMLWPQPWPKPPGTSGSWRGTTLLLIPGRASYSPMTPIMGLPAAPLRGDGGRHTCDAELDLEPVLLKGGGDELAALLLKEPVLGEAPDLVAYLGQLVSCDPLSTSTLFPSTWRTRFSFSGKKLWTNDHVTLLLEAWSWLAF